VEGVERIEVAMKLRRVLVEVACSEAEMLIVYLLVVCCDWPVRCVRREGPDCRADHLAMSRSRIGSAEQAAGLVGDAAMAWRSFRHLESNGLGPPACA
jgi:hypothetical protein